MAEERIRYRKLPGHRRGLINGSSVWLGPDHLLLVKSQRFKEEYKRFYLRDIQAIAVARCGRFHLSTRSMLVALLWIVALGASQVYTGMTGFVWGVALLLVGAWLYISVDRSCVCRIYTAVSSDPLPSVYRTWTARRFLAAVEPRIREVQGEIDPAWREAPDVEPLPRARAGIVPHQQAAPAPPPRTGAVRTPATGIFLTTLLLEAAVDLAGFAPRAPDLTWVLAGIIVAQMIAAIFVFIDRNRGRLASAIHQVAIAKLVWLTLLFYINSGINAVNRTTMVPLAPANSVMRGADLAVSIGLLAAGLVLSWRSADDPPPGLLGN
jgi:hypothetical protein